MSRFRECKSAVSSVIGAVMLVGMTVIMVSIIALSVFASGAFEQEIAPEARIVAVEASGDIDEALYKNKIVLKHKGGSMLAENDTRIIIAGKGCAYTGDMGTSCVLGNMRATYENLNGDNYVESYDDLIEGTSWDAGETITLYGSDGRDLDFLGDRHNTVDSKWKLEVGSTISITIIDTATNKIIAVPQATVKHP